MFEQGKPRIVSSDILKEFRGENNVHGLPSDPPHPSFQGGDEMTEIPNLELKGSITEEIKIQERQLDRRERDPGEKRDTAGQTEPQEVGQTNRKTQITSSCEEAREEPPTSLDLDGEVEMQGGEERGVEHQSDTRLENQEELTLPNQTQENEIDMQERGTGVKRGQSEHVENPVIGKLRRREGIKHGLRGQ